VINGEQAVPLGGPKKRGLLALLLLHANETVPTEKLIDALWGDDPPRSARSIVQSYVSQLRKQLHCDVTSGESTILQTRPAGYLLKVGSGELDVDDFLQLAEDGRTALRLGSLDQASTKLAAAMSLLNGSPLADLASEPFAQSHIARLEELAVATLEDRIEADLALGRHSHVIARLDVAIADHPLRERLRELMMLALYRTGRQAEALNVFRDTRVQLVDELGIEPGRALQDLQARILAEDPTLLSERAEPETPGNLGVPLTTFVGRERELHELRELTKKERLITLNGIGGVGKSRLAIELATSRKGAFQDGVWIIQLGPLTDESLISQSVAAALNIREQPDQEMLGTLLDFVRNREILLILDNCEHLIRGCALFAETALSHAPNLRIIATSRESLGITGEIQWRVPSLNLPDLQQSSLEQARSSEAIELFHQRAREVNNRFVLTEDNWTTVVRICERLDGIPLAIELAAGLCKALSAKEISDRLVDRFSLLTGGSRTALPRQQTLVATMDWSYDLLPEEEQRILRQLSVFSGGFSLEAAEAVVGEDAEPLEILRGIVSLVGKSLIVQEQERSNTRYDILETVRQYAAQKLLESGESATARNRHLDYFLDRAEGAEPHLHAGSQEAVVASLELEHDNYRAALDWSIDRIPDKAIRLAAALWYFWDVHGDLSVGRRWLKNALDDKREFANHSHAWALIGAGSLARAQGDIDEADGFLQRALTSYRELADQRGTAKALDELAALAYLQGNHQRGESLCRESRDLYEQAGEPEGVASTLFSLGHWAATTGNYVESDQLLRKSLELCESLRFLQGRGAALASLARLNLYLGDFQPASELADRARTFSARINDDWNIAFLDFILGEIDKHLGAFAAAEEHHRASLVSFRKRGDMWGIARTLRALASVKRRSNAFGQALAMLQQSLHLCLKLNDRWEMAQVLEEMSHLRMHSQETRSALLLFGSAQALRTVIGTPFPPCDEGDSQELVRLAEEELGVKTTNELIDGGRRCDMGTVIKLVLPETSSEDILPGVVFSPSWATSYSPID